MERQGKRKCGYMEERQVPRWLVLCGHDPEQTCWYHWQLFLNVVRHYLLGQFGPSLLMASGLQVSRKVLLQTKGLRSANKECISLKTGWSAITLGSQYDPEIKAKKKEHKKIKLHGNTP